MTFFVLLLEVINFNGVYINEANGGLMNAVDIKLGEKSAEGFEIPLKNAVLVVACGKRGFVMCGYLNLETSEKMGDAACVVKGIKTIDELLDGKVVGATSEAKKLGVEPGMSGREALGRLA